MRIAIRMALVALVIGTATAVAATGRIDLSLVGSGAACWSFVPVLQLLTGLFLVRGASIPAADALDLYFQTHRPWSFWLLAFAFVLFLLPGPGGMTLVLSLTFVVPLILTIRALKALCGGPLGFSREAAARRVRIHQAATVALMLAYAIWAIGGIDRVMSQGAP